MPCGHVHDGDCGYLPASGTPTVDSGDPAVAGGTVITAFADLPDGLRWQRTSTPNLPETVEAQFYGQTASIPVIW